MRKRLLFAGVCIFLVPIVLSLDKNKRPEFRALISAEAGQTQQGMWCECGTPACMCDPGEQPGGTAAVGNQTEAEVANQTADQTTGIETMTTLAAVIMLTLFLLIRIR